MKLYASPTANPSPVNCVAIPTSSNPLNPSSTVHALPFSLGCRNSHERPTTRRPGGRLPSVSMASATWARVVRMTRWSGQLARSMTAQGVERGQRGLVEGAVVSDEECSFSTGVVSSATRPTMRCRAMRKTTVREGTYSGGSGALPFLPVPVQMRTWSATSRWVAGMAANRGALRALVTPGRTVTAPAAEKPFWRK